ncbi:ec87 protein [Colletotrichum incanum]|nr:ec87 protein [Colletotrichum incanum]
MRATFAIVTLLAASVSAFFDGPCTDTECASPNQPTLNCEENGMVCVPFPVVSVEGRKGCACSVA